MNQNSQQAIFETKKKSSTHLQEGGVEHELAGLVSFRADIDSLAVGKLVLCEGNLCACAASKQTW